MDKVIYPATERKRHPGDVARLVLGVTAFVLIFLLAFGGRVSQTEEYLFRLINGLPGHVYPLIAIVMQTGSFAFVWLAAVIAASLRRYRLAFKIASSGTAAWLLVKLAKMLAQRDRPAYLFRGIFDRAHATGILGFPSGHAAVAAALATVISPYVSKTWRRWMWVAVWIVAIARVYGGAHLPLDVLAGVSLGWAVGSTTNLLFGTPAWPIPVGAIERKLRMARIGVANVELAGVDARGSTPLVITTKRSKKYFAKLINSENRNADMLYKLWRFITLKEHEREAPFASAKHLIEHEAYMYGQAANAGARVPRVRLAAPVTGKAAVLVMEWVPGKTLTVYDDPLTLQLLTNVWRQVKVIHDADLVHRDLRAANVMIDVGGQPWLIDFAFAEVASGPEPLAMDRAELLVSLSLRADPKVVVRAAVRVFGASTIGETLDYLQPASLSANTREQLKKHKEALVLVRRSVIELTGIGESTPTSAYRVSYQTAIWIGLSVLLLVVVATQFRHVDQYLKALAHIGLWWMLAAIAASLLTYVASAVVVLGSTSFRLTYAKVFLLQFATTFVDRFTPLNVGQVVITQRFLENTGLERAKAVASTSVIYLVGVVTHVALIFVVAALFVRHPVHIHSPKSWAIILVIVLVLSAVALYLTPKLRPHIQKYVTASRETIRQTFLRPLKTLQLFGGSLGVSLFYGLSLYYSLRGFGVELPFDKVLLVYLAGAAIASASAIPGGLGVTEVALVAGLVTFGVPEAAAVLAVLSYRLFTYLLPTLPGVFAFRHLQKRGLLNI